MFERVFVARLLTMSRKRDCLLRSTRKFIFCFFLGATHRCHLYIPRVFFVPCTHLLACFCSTCFPTAAFEMFSFDCDRKKSCVCVCSSIIHTHSLALSIFPPFGRRLLVAPHSATSAACVCVFLLYGLRSPHTSPSTLVYHSDRSSATATQQKKGK